MNVPDLDHLTAARALVALRAGELDAEALLDACLARIAQRNPHLNALIALAPADGLRSAARAADRRLAAHRGGGEAPPPLLGLPVSIKDSFATRDLPTTSGFRPLAGHLPAGDASVVARLRAAGALILGKSNLPELAGAPHCWNPLFGPTRNPWRPDLTPGGSSGGAAAAVAAGFSLLELGSDLAGSIRIPAAYCGVFGLKATEHRIPGSGHIPPLPPHLAPGGRSVRHLLSFGLLGRSVADLHLGYGLIAGPDGHDHEVPPFPPPPPLPSQRDVARLRIAVWDDFAGLPLCPHARAALSGAISRLRRQGHEVRPIPAPFDVEAAWWGSGVGARTEVGLGMPAWQRLGMRAAAPFLSRADPIARAFASGLRGDFRRYDAALGLRDRLIGELDRCLGAWDAVLCPVAATGPYPGRPMPAHAVPPRLRVDGRMLPYLQATIALTVPFSLTGHPVLAMPLGPEEGLPVGVQLIGRRWDESALLSCGAMMETALGDFVPPPPPAGR